MPENPQELMKSYRYSTKEIGKEYFRSGTGFTVSALPLLLFHPSSVIVWLLGSISCLFALYGIRAVGRSKLEIQVTDRDIRLVARRTRAIHWEDLEQVTLSYFSTRRDGERGWLQLAVKGKGVRLKMESTLENFEELAAICLHEAAARGVALDAATVRNGRAVGLLPDLQETGF